jgi:hypothetical protein
MPPPIRSTGRPAPMRGPGAPRTFPPLPLPLPWLPLSFLARAGTLSASNRAIGIIKLFMPRSLLSIPSGTSTDHSNHTSPLLSVWSRTNLVRRADIKLTLEACVNLLARALNRLDVARHRVLWSKLGPRNTMETVFFLGRNKISPSTLNSYFSERDQWAPGVAARP